MKKQIRTITIEEFFEKIAGKVYWVWKICGEKNWRVEETPYKEIPWVEIKKSKTKNLIN